MSSRHEPRSHAAPMDFEFTNKSRNVIAPDSPFNKNNIVPLKRPLERLDPQKPSFPQRDISPTFGVNRDVPFLLNHPIPRSEPVNHWTPSRSPQTDAHEISMEDATSARLHALSPKTGDRPIATGALTRVFRSRQKEREKSGPGRGRRRRMHNENEDDVGYASDTHDEDSEDDIVGQLATSPRGRRVLQKSQSDPVTTTTNHNHHYTFHVPTPKLSQSEIPYLLLGYLQFFFNLSLVIGFLYLAYCFIRAVQRDVEQKMVENTLETLQEINVCTTLYADNYCADKPAPYMVMQCQEWKACMERDASIVNRSRLLAELIGEVINSFMEPISWRTMIFGTTSLALGIGFVNSLLMFYRSRHAPESHTVPQTNPMTIPPYWGQTPTTLPYLMQKSNQGQDFKRTWSVPPGDDSRDVLETPSRRRRLNGPEVASEVDR